MIGFFFEHTWIPLSVGLLVCVIASVTWSIRRSVFPARVAWVSLLGGIVLAIVSHFVVTSRELVDDICQRLAQSVQQGDIDEISRQLAPGFEAGRMDRDTFVERLRQTLTNFRIDDTRIRGVSVKILDSGTRAVAQFRATCHLRSVDAVYDRIVSAWRVSFRQVENHWRITTIESVPIPPLNISNLSDWLR